MSNRATGTKSTAVVASSASVGNQTTAARFKDRGNALFAQRQLPAAAAAYTQAMDLLRAQQDREETGRAHHRYHDHHHNGEAEKDLLLYAVVCSNRSACYYEMGHFDQAAVDAHTCMDYLDDLLRLQHKFEDTLAHVPVLSAADESKAVSMRAANQWRRTRALLYQHDGDLHQAQARLDDLSLHGSNNNNNNNIDKDRKEGNAGSNEGEEEDENTLNAVAEASSAQQQQQEEEEEQVSMHKARPKDSSTYGRLLLWPLRVLLSLVQVTPWASVLTAIVSSCRAPDKMLSTTRTDGEGNHVRKHCRQQQGKPTGRGIGKASPHSANLRILIGFCFLLSHCEAFSTTPPTTAKRTARSCSLLQMTTLSGVNPTWNDTGMSGETTEDSWGAFAFPASTRAVNSYWKPANNTATVASSSTGATTAATITTATTTTLGDIMGLVTESEGLAAHYGIRHPLDRMALTANGNLQRLVSSYYDAPVSVVVQYCRARSMDQTGRGALRTWDRQVALQVFGQTFCVATSVIHVHDPQCVDWVERGQVGLGQLFRTLNVLPTFSLQEAGVSPPSDAEDIVPSPGGGGFWRQYKLECAHLTCEIHEEFVDGLWSLSPLTSL